MLSLSNKVQGATIFDGFSGSTRVSQAYAQAQYTVYANDIAEYAQVFNTAYLLNEQEPHAYQALIDHLNALKPIDGWFTDNYGGEDAGGKSVGNDGFKKPWQKKNTRKLDAVREEIDRLNLDAITKAVCIVSLILALDQVDSTVGHYAAYLDDWSPRSYKDLILEVPHLWINRKKHTVMRADVFDAIKALPSGIDLAYLDPPYGSNNEKMPPSRVRYAAYYHIWTTICLNDTPVLFGKAKRRVDTRDTVAASVFEEFRKNRNDRKNTSERFIAVAAVEKLIQQVPAAYVILSYSSGGRATFQELYDALTASGKLLALQKIDYKKNSMTAMKWTNDWAQDSAERHYEYLFLLEKK
ncbi:MAG: DNA adenine methylase [Treponema sp.]|nr:DNA adenine methylase [Treponema sp.]